MRIAYFADIRFPIERANGIQTAETCHALAARGHDVELVVRPDTHRPTRDPLAFYDLGRSVPLRVRRVPSRGPAPVRRLEYLASAVAFTLGPAKPDVIFTRDLGVAAWLLRLRPGSRPPVVYEAHGVAAVVSGQMDQLLTGARPASTGKQRRLERRERLVWNRADAYVTITAALAEDLEARFGRRPRLAVVPDGMRLPATPRSRQPFSGEGRPLVVYAGHLYPWKGVDTLIDALARVPGVDARIVGGHPAEPDLARIRTKVHALGLSDRVTLTGLVPPGEVAAHLADADVLVLPNSATAVSARYTSPLKLFEALAAGRAIVASDLPALREVLEHEENALLVPPDDATALGGAIERLLADRALAGRLAARALDIAPAYSWSRRAERLEAVLHAALDR